MNVVTILGRVVKDTETKPTQNSQYSRFTVAVRRDKENSDFISCIAWGKASEFASHYLKKGLQVAITGRLQTGQYDDKDGKRVYTTDVIVGNIEVIWDKKDKTDEPRQDVVTDDDLPF